MDDQQLLDDYKAYYKSRMMRFKDNPLYPESFKSEQALFEAMNGCSRLEEFKDRLGDLNIKNAIALVKDKAKARRDNFLKMTETVRAAGEEKVLAAVDRAKDANEVVTIVTEIEQQHAVEISLDGFIDEFYHSFKLLEDVIVAERAIVPDRWKEDEKQAAQRDRERIAESYNDNIVQARLWKSDWQFNFDLIFEERHRRRIPFSDEVVKKRFEQYRTIVENS